jgi:hypothetical protein
VGVVKDSSQNNKSTPPITNLVFVLIAS